LYDTGTNKILKCEEDEKDLLIDLLTIDVSAAVDNFCARHAPSVAMKTINSIMRTFETENILKLMQIDNFGMSHDSDALFDSVNNKLRMIQLEVTEKCNLRCGYCVYNDFFNEKRNHGNAVMTIETAKKAIDYLGMHSKAIEKVSISFYGGEPLLNYDLIRNAVKYAKDSLAKKELSFSITTNATLINERIADFLCKEDFSILISLDGPEAIHDSWRKTKDGRGSFSLTHLGLRTLIKKLGPSPKLGLSIVYAPPYNEQKMNDIADFINTIDLFREDVLINITYPSSGSIPINDSFDAQKNDRSLWEWAKNDYTNKYAQDQRFHPISRAVIERSLAKIVQRPVFDFPIKKAFLNGCCLPGSRKIYITAKGDIQVCEKIGKAPALGNLDSGLNLDILKGTFIEEYSKRSLEDCSRCWLVRLCDLCYLHAFNNNEIDIGMKRIYCKLRRASLLDELVLFCSLIERNDKGLDYLYEMEIN
jgi:uncharacterized protein